MPKHLHLLFTCCVLSLLGCGDQAAYVEQDRSLLPIPVALKSELVFIDTAGHRAYLLDATAERSDAAVREVNLPLSPRLAERRNGTHDEALVLCEGRRASASAGAEPAALSVIEPDGDVRVYELGKTPFDTLHQSDDGRYAVLLRSDQSPDRLLNNANELVVIDLDRKPGATFAVTHRTPPSFGNIPTRALFSPVMRIAGEDRRLLVLLSAAEVMLIDLGHLDRRETIVQLGGAEGRSVQPTQVLFGADATLYVRGSSTDDIFVFRFEPHDNDPLGNDFRPSINLLGGGEAPRDMALFGEALGTRLLVVAELSSEVLVIDPTSSKATQVSLPEPQDQILLFTGTSPNDAESRPRALLHGGSAASVYFLDLDDVDTRRGRNLERLPLGAAVARMIPLQDDRRVLILHQNAGVSLLDLQQRTIKPVSSSAPVLDALFDPKQDRLWVGPAAQPRIGTLDLTAGETDELLLDEAIQVLVPMFTAGKLAVIHPSEIGHVTFVDAADPARAAARSVRGFLLSGVLDRGES